MLRHLGQQATASLRSWAFPTAECETKEEVSVQGMLDPDRLERAAKAVRDIDKSANAKMVYEQLKQQELSKQAESKKDEAGLLSQARQHERATEEFRQQEEHKREEERSKHRQQQMQLQAQLDERKMQQQNEIQQRTNQEYLEQQKRMNLEVEERKLQLTRQMEAERKQSMQYEAELQKEVAKEKALAEGRARALEHRENRDIFMQEISQQATEWGKQYLVLFQECMKDIGYAGKLLLSTEYGPQALYGAAGLFAAYYGVRGGIGLTYRQLERFLVTPPLVRETSRYNMLQRLRGSLGLTPGGTRMAMDEALVRADKTFSDIILAPEIKHTVRALAASAANTRMHGAPFRHYLLYGPPGTGKTLLAKRLAHTSGLEYAIMSGGDVAPLGNEAVKQIHDMFDWAKRSNKGMLLFVDEADAFLSHRGHQGEALRSAINAMLFRTGDQSTDYMVILATNRPEDLDRAVLDRVDEQLEVALPTEPLREQLLHLYFQKYLVDAQDASRGAGGLSGLMRGIRTLTAGRAAPNRIDVSGVDQGKLVREAAGRTEGFSGRELAKLMASVQAAAYGTPSAKLTEEVFNMVLGLKLKQHGMRAALLQDDPAAATGDRYRAEAVEPVAQLRAAIA